MIYLHTGQPGAGKTLYTLQLVRERAKVENRAVYYAGIDILKPEAFPGWERLEEPAKWFDLPDGAIIVHDECQTLYRPRGTGSATPEHVARFETHRHKGHDIYLITQHPMLVDGNIRRLAGEHRHIVRAWGAKLSTVHSWGQVKENCDKSRGDSIKTPFKYPADLFDAYKSATLHTHKFRMPKRVWFLFAMPIIVAALIWGAVQWMRDRANATVQPETSSPGQTAPGAPRAEKMTLAEYAQDRAPRVPGLPHTAPVYDKVTTPTKAPVPAACVQWAGKGCRCYTQQGTRMDTDYALCQAIVQRGYFVDFEPEGREGGRARDRDQDRRDEPVKVAAGSRDEPENPLELR